MQVSAFHTSPVFLIAFCKKMKTTPSKQLSQYNNIKILVK